MKKLLLILALLPVAACGFEPVYGTGSGARAYGVEEHLALVSIGNIPDREGQYLRNALIDRFYRHGRPETPAYTLSISPVREKLIDLDITKTSDATRGQLRLDTRMILRDKASGETLLSRNLRSLTSYNIIASEFANRVTEDNARLNALDDLARQVELQLSLYFRQDP